jgi:Phage integrase, N-terminal SAM-like domain/Arm DNA-binding domain
MGSRKRPAVDGVSVFTRNMGKSWIYQVELEPDPLTGKRQREYKSGFATEDEAWTAAIGAKKAAEAGRRVPPSKRTVADFFKEWLTTVEHSIKPSTRSNYVDYLDAYVLPSIGGRRLQDIDVPILNTLYRRLLKEGRCKPDNNSKMFATGRRGRRPAWSRSRPKSPGTAR